MANNKASKFFDAYAFKFNRIYGNENTLLNGLINKYFRKSMKLRFINTLLGCSPAANMRVLDIGCAPGHIGITLAKYGAKYVLGLDFSKEMVELAKKNALRAGVDEKCKYICSDFLAYDFKDNFDYSIVMGVMDYIEEPAKFIERVLNITKSRAFFSFPVDGGFLAWQRKVRYKKRCDLYMYKKEQITELFGKMKCKEIKIEKISRDYFVTVYL